ncbi:MAG TPA: hypothetical protein DIU15_14625 [Deltaproteobacteria bacterium]|nr:hypothetical protein [Deltaproteobacteria bacterium]HCP47273.1 hypothetical protein [Deltaproteobacteria bacterium]
MKTAGTSRPGTSLRWVLQRARRSTPILETPRSGGRRKLLAGLVLLLAGCAQPPPEAPTELGDLTLYLFSNFEADEEVLLAGVSNLGAFLDQGVWDDFIPGSSREGREWTPPTLTSDHFGGIPETEGVEPDEQLPVAVASWSDHAPEARAELVALRDQTPVEAPSSASYDRDFLTDIDCFTDLSCRFVRTTNVIHRDQLVLDVVYEAYKDFQWVGMPDGQQALLARSWTTEVFPEDDGQDSLDQSYNLEVWLPRPGGALGLNVVWSSVTLPAVSDDSLIASVTAGVIDQIYVATEEYLNGEGD